MLEKQIEIYFKKQVAAVGGWAIKFIPISLSGFPDRIVLMPGARVYFVELKRPGKKPRKLQIVIHDKLRKYGFKVFVIDSLELVQQFIKSL
jgi:hypothetical protein